MDTARTCIVDTKPGQKLWLAYAAVVFTAILLRCLLALVNREANDDHLEVTRLLMVQFRSLSLRDCHECFHPKLFYIFHALLFKAFGVTNANTQLLVAQLLNAFAGVFMLAVIWTSMHGQESSPTNLFFSFSLIALNPKLIAINAQCSNDTFAMLFSTIAIYFAYLLLEKGKLSHMALTQASLCGAVLSKGTTWVVAIAIVLALLGKAGAGTGRTRRYWLYACVTAFTAWGAIQWGDYDFKHYDRYAHLGKDKPLYLFRRTVVGRPGVISIADSYFTFRFVDLLAHPMITNDLDLNPVHRSSAWTQLYGHLHFAHFDNHPPSWRTSDPVIVGVGRAVFLLALAPTAILAVGSIASLRRIINAVSVHKLKAIADHRDYFYPLIAAGYLAFFIKFTHDYRDFAAMKAIYLFPGMVAFSHLFLIGLNIVTRAMNMRLRHLLWALLIALLSCYALDIGLLIEQLSAVPAIDCE